ncbi:FeoA family protein [Anaerotignum propionicum]|jgi:ferrous iron transport protein A|uniref:FeoA domain protein n=1 Tax=Anaerotignum propionicum DSM 1682 TaxID=991789 RepID=A0A110A829_ANAPI|nr:FeoA family protein [Anaerotignum propionicum]AMJ42278.1 FeoA domain protein [Anaerotignum propionicum DSM 1682]MEA5056803.1 FeoA family protein [Anaerotignum propionicum]SHE55422.1 ferrous iron transport protein A [[Clostridium] propionicum DSM 1682] [Anaerotignum propionicum DSM 1682]HBF65117.1 ferrous iron transport protein A [Clostridium sp.]
MPLLLAEIDIPYIIVRIAGREKERHHLESLGLIPNTVITVVSKFNNYILINVKDSRIGIGEDLAKKVILK